MSTTTPGPWLAIGQSVVHEAEARDVRVAETGNGANARLIAKTPELQQLATDYLHILLRTRYDHMAGAAWDGDLSTTHVEDKELLQILEEDIARVAGVLAAALEEPNSPSFYTEMVAQAESEAKQLAAEIQQHEEQLRRQQEMDLQYLDECDARAKLERE